jgi:hypothetical protein
MLEDYAQPRPIDGRRTHQMLQDAFADKRYGWPL